MTERVRGGGVAKVHCRIGSSEMYEHGHDRLVLVHCRIGSSENNQNVAPFVTIVHCRIGSSENPRRPVVEPNSVHCRIGSSEMQNVSVQRVVERSLSHRQLRNRRKRQRNPVYSFTAA